MAQFLSTITNKIDAKGRVSVPADFRAVLGKQGSGALILGPLARAAALEGGGDEYLADVQAKIDSLPAFSPERDFLIDSILPSLRQMSFDGEGRIMLTEEQIEYAGLVRGGSAVFVGRGLSFQVWEPDAWTARRREAMERSRAFFQRGGAGA